MITYILISYVFMLARCSYGHAKDGGGKFWFKIFLVSPLSFPFVVFVDLFDW